MDPVLTRCPKCQKLIRSSQTKLFCSSGYNSDKSKPIKVKVVPGLHPSGATVCECGYAAFRSPSQVVKCPICSREFWVESKEDQGRRAWAALHGMEDPTPEKIVQWKKLIPRFGCDCVNFTERYIESIPIRYDDFKRWAWEFHNAVNKKLGKPFFNEADALSGKTERAFRILP